jgi:hypothetical protein
MNMTTEEVRHHEPNTILHLTVFYNGMPKGIDIDREATVKTLLERAIALFGNLPQPHTLSLWTEKGVELSNEQETLKAANVKDCESLILRPSAVKGGDA